MLYVKLISPSSTKSLSVYDSDILGNLLHMEALVGTLVKYGNRGIYEPYFAKSWTINKQKTQFKFFLENNLLDESGEPQSAQTYFNTLHILLKKYSETTEPPIFSTLLGWHDFKIGKQNYISGIKLDVATNSISFNFDRPASGLMEFLAMPYFGFYNQNDFTLDGAWKNNKTIVATGGYKLVEIADNKIILQKRSDFKINNLNSYENITVETTADTKVSSLQNHQILIHNSELEFENAEINLKTFRSAPTFLYTYEINPKSKKFNNLIERKKFHYTLRKATEDVLKKTTNVIPAYGFYKDDQSAEINNSFDLNSTPSVVFLKRKNNQKTKYDLISDQILETLQNQSRIKINIKDNIPGTGYIKSFEFNDTFDFRIKSVDIGYSPENWVIKMMFCSNLGATFPDPDQQIMKLTENYDNGVFAEDAEYADAFEEIWRNQAYLVPIFRDGFSFSITEKISPESISKTTNIPRIDLITPIN